MPDKNPSKPTSTPQILFVRVPYVLAGVLFLVAVVINIANVIGRYVFATPIFWAEEVLVFIVVWSTFITGISIAYSGSHLSMDLLYSKFPPTLKLIVNCAITICFVGCAVFVASQSFKVVQLYWQTQGVSSAAEIPLIIPHSALFVGFSLIAVAVIFRLRAYITGAFN